MSLISIRYFYQIIITYFISIILYKYFMEVINMSIEKQKLFNEIETLPDELTNQVIDFIEYLYSRCGESRSAHSVPVQSRARRGGSGR